MFLTLTDTAEDVSEQDPNVHIIVLGAKRKRSHKPQDVSQQKFCSSQIGYRFGEFSVGRHLVLLRNSKRNVLDVYKSLITTALGWEIV